MKFTIKDVGEVAENYVGGKVRCYALKDSKLVRILKTIDSVRTEPVGRGDVYMVVVTKDGAQLRFDANRNGILLDDGRFMGEDEQFTFFPPNKPDAK